VKATNSVGSHTKALSITIGNVGIASTTLSNQITVYPNPTMGELRIESLELSVKNVEIFDTFGRKILSHTENRLPQTTLDISHLPSGIYFLKIHTEKGLINKKVVKQ
jgi:hypothetical protein